MLIVLTTKIFTNLKSESSIFEENLSLALVPTEAFFGKHQESRNQLVGDKTLPGAQSYLLKFSSKDIYSSFIRLKTGNHPLLFRELTWTREQKRDDHSLKFNNLSFSPLHYIQGKIKCTPKTTLSIIIIILKCVAKNLGFEKWITNNYSYFFGHIRCENLASLIVIIRCTFSYR